MILETNIKGFFKEWKYGFGKTNALKPEKKTLSISVLTKPQSVENTRHAEVQNTCELNIKKHYLEMQLLNLSKNLKLFI